MNTKIRFHHFHEGNDPWIVSKETKEVTRVRGPAAYATFAALVDIDTGDTLEEVAAYCSPRDNPSRSKGREITLGRLFKVIGEKLYGIEDVSSEDRQPSQVEKLKRFVWQSKYLWSKGYHKDLYATLQAAYLPKSSVDHLL